jgi:hypothetical protein
MFLAELEELFKVKLTISVFVVSAENGFGQTFGQILAFVRLLPIRVSVPIFVILK